MDWNSPEARLGLIESVGPSEYNRQIKAEHKRRTVGTVAGHDIRTVSSRFGQLFQVGSTGVAFQTYVEAERFAKNAGASQ
jgi:hypothetical protein